jgi:hypothetical protein
MRNAIKRVYKFLAYGIRRIRGLEKVCTKKKPFVPPLKEGVWWTHKDAYEKYPEHDFSIVVYHCPNCGTDFEIDWGD